MKKYAYFLAGLLMAAGLASCVDDEGHYTLSPINEVEIANIDHEDGYNVVLGGEPLVIAPDVKGSMAELNDPDRYAYRWYIKVSLSEDGLQKGNLELGTERELHYEPKDIAPGSYTLYFEVADKETGLKFLTNMKLLIQSQTMTGFLVLGETADGSTKMDMVAMMDKVDTLLVEDVFADPAIRNPQALFFTGATRYGTDRNLWLTTESTSYSMTNGSYFKVLEDNTLDGKLLTSFDIRRPARVLDMFPRQDGQAGGRASTLRGYITDDAIFMTSMMSDEQIFGNPSNRYDELSDELFTPYPLAFIKNGYISSSSLNVVFYDMDNRCFVVPNTNMLILGVTKCNRLQDREGDPFKWDQTGTTRQLVYGQNGNQNDSYALMKDDEGKWFVYVFSVTSIYAPSKKAAYEIDPAVAANFGQATHYAFSSDETEILYAVGSQLWGYDYGRKKCKMLKDYGKEIVYLVQDTESTADKSEFNMAVSGDDYKSTFCKIALKSDPDDIVLEEDEALVWEINSKVKSVVWKNASDLSDESGYY